MRARASKHAADCRKFWPCSERRLRRKKMQFQCYFILILLWPFTRDKMSILTKNVKNEIGRKWAGRKLGFTALMMYFYNCLRYDKSCDFPLNYKYTGANLYYKFMLTYTPWQLYNTEHIAGSDEATIAGWPPHVRTQEKTLNGHCR